MDFDFPPQDDPRRIKLREWLEANPAPTPQQLLAAGLIVPNWPEPYGIDADPLHQLIIDEELARVNVRRPQNPIGIGWAGPTILAAGSEEQKQRFLPGLLTGSDIYCQMFSEPDAGSDLASLATSALRDGDEYIINGSKIWTSGAHHAKYGILIARTNPNVPKHKGISYFVCPTNLPGVTISPIIDMTGAHSFNQIFFDNVRIPRENRIGAENDGWRLAKVTLANERVSLSSSGSLWGAGPNAAMLIDLMKRNGGVTDPQMRQRAAALHIDAEVLRLNRLRTLSAQLNAQTPGPEASIQKIMADEHGQQVMQLAKDFAGAQGMLEGSGPLGVIPPNMAGGATEIIFKDDQVAGVNRIWHYGFLFSPALTLGGGTFAVLRNIVAEMVLGLPREPSADKGKTWLETRHRNSAVTDASR
ncbi:MAG: acyl-CoA dehydrogenase family protein [Acidimicrobiia bacterium]|nr:acyl-CoA dehydrogenase family protein [Acidimicrobiia bacterium]